MYLSVQTFISAQASSSKRWGGNIEEASSCNYDTCPLSVPPHVYSDSEWFSFWMYPYVYLNQGQFVPMEEEGLPFLAMIGAVRKLAVLKLAESTFLYFMTGLKKGKGFQKIWQTIILFLHKSFAMVLKPIP